MLINCYESNGGLLWIANGKLKGRGNIYHLLYNITKKIFHNNFLANSECLEVVANQLLTAYDTQYITLQHQRINL